MEPLLTKHVREPNSFTLDFYLKHDGYEGLKKALAMPPEQVIEAVKASGLRGRGGAGFPTGMKWQFVDKKSPNPKYIACNADESEPGTFKDREIMEIYPHELIEGVAIGSYAIGGVLEAAWTLLRRADEPPMTRFLAAQLAKDHFFALGRARADFGYAPRVSTTEGMEKLRRSLARP